MSLSDCEKCWETPCTCGYAYRNYSIQQRKQLAAAVLGVAIETMDMVTAAPEAIALLEEVIEDYDICCESEGWTNKAMALIKKARGEK